MKKYFSPVINSYNSENILEYSGPAQTASVNVTIGATAFNTNQPAIYKNIDAEYRLAEKITNNVREVA